MPTRLAVKSPRLFVFILAAACCPPAGESKPGDAEKAAPAAADSMLGKKAGEVRDDNGLKMKLVWCPPGEFKMGSPKSEANRKNSEDQVEVTLTRGFWLGKYEATQSEWKQVVVTEPWKDKKRVKEGDDFPVTYVSWDDAKEFCRKLTELERKAGRLPNGWEYSLATEAQWERACRAGTDTKFSFGDDESKLGEYAWFSEDGGKTAQNYPHDVGQKNPNPWGLFDMHGNVWEWCRDGYGDKLPGGRDPEAPDKGSGRVYRGGSWSSMARYSRSAYRFGIDPSSRYHYVGFRVALSPSGNQ